MTHFLSTAKETPGEAVQVHPSLTNHNPSNYSANASFVYSAKNTGPVLALLDAQPGERIVDLGCGTGELTRLIQGMVRPSPHAELQGGEDRGAGITGGGGQVVGVDSNESMLTKARSASIGNNNNINIQYIQADIQNLPSFTAAHPELEGSFDKVFTSATLHWCKSPEGVVELVRWLLKDGGKMVFEFGGFGNCVGIRAALHRALIRRKIDPIPLDPWYFPTAAQYERVLTDAQLQPQNVHLVPRPTPLPTSLGGWLKTFARSSFLASFNDDEAQTIIDEVVEGCRVDHYWSDAVPGIGVQAQANAQAQNQVQDKQQQQQQDDGEAEKKEGWEVMYVRIRGSAIKA